MGLSIAHIIQLIISIVGLILNLIVGGVVSFGLKLKSIDLILILVISLIDIYFYVHNIVRAILINIDYLVITNKLNPQPSWWCPYDSTVNLTVFLSCVELVAILSFMRYLSICKRKNINGFIWYSIASFSFFTNLIFAVVYLHNGFYKWSVSGLICIPGDNPDSSYKVFKIYYYVWLSNYIIRVILSLIIIAFSYFNMTNEYYEIISSSGDIILKAQIKSSIKVINSQDSSQYYEAGTNIVDDYKSQKKAVRKQKLITTLKLIGAIFAYSVCLMPDIFLNVTNLILMGTYNFTFDLTAISGSNLLLTCCGLVNALFVLLSHEPSRRHLSFKIECFVSDIRTCLGLCFYN
ncbi:hypothetical protein K502DRAFT_349369 [Neoconidiobolus thromboides FSU 785]|nr:hypothetical protein K502DRAFT_349369 [Neoconidiobolus thromboides FSU 785]